MSHGNELPSRCRVGFWRDRHVPTTFLCYGVSVLLSSWQTWLSDAQQGEREVHCRGFGCLESRT